MMLSTSFPHLAQRLFNTPLMLRAEKAEVLMAALAERMGVTHMLREGGPLASSFEAEDYGQAADDKQYEVVTGVAVIPITGTLVHKGGWMAAYSGLTGYDFIRSSFLQAVDDAEVKAVVLDIDSPGGEVSGCFDLADTIYAARGAKPIHAILTESAYSAAYALASAADRILVPRTGGVGSIGVIAMLVDLSKAMTTAGLTVNIIQFGARKADGTEFRELPDEARAAFQEQVDDMGELFVDTVARNRGLAASKIRATEAATFLAPRGVALGLADAVMSPDAAFADLLRSIA